MEKTQMSFKIFVGFKRESKGKYFGKLKYAMTMVPTFLAPGTGFLEGNFSTDPERNGLGMILIRSSKQRFFVSVVHSTVCASMRI